MSVLLSIQGEAINFANIGKSPVHPLIYAKSAKKAGADARDARYAISM
jgi:hypothetical protein